MRRCELLGLYFQTKFFSNHSQLFSWWSTLRCYVKTLRKDQRIINWKSLDRISTCQFKCMWPQPASVSSTYWDISLNLVCFVSGTFPQLTLITGFYSLILIAGRYQRLASVSWCHMCHPHSHTDTRDPGNGGRGLISNLNLLYGHRINCPWPYLNFKAMMLLRPFFHPPPSDGGDRGWWGDQARPPGQLVTWPWWPLWWPALLVTSPALPRAPDITMSTIQNTECISMSNVCTSLHGKWFVTKCITVQHSNSDHCNVECCLSIMSFWVEWATSVW